MKRQRLATLIAMVNRLAKLGERNVKVERKVIGRESSNESKRKKIRKGKKEGKRRKRLKSVE